jgi:cupin 2 domain-containing protein
MTPAEIANLFTPLPDAGDGERFDLLQQVEGIRIERIISRGHATPPGDWYDQDAAEWVVLLRGAAVIRFEDDPASVRLSPGDHVLIAPHRRHRVEWTDPAQTSIWLAVHAPGRAPA